MAPVRDLTPGSDGADPGAEEIRERHPESAAWRADALAASRHRRLADEIPQPKDDFDARRAEAICAEICRDLLRDYAPGLVLLTAGERRRLQALAAYSRTLFDFARQRGLEGERMAQINRWEFTLESALSGQPVGQPVFVAMASCERERPWPREALDDLATAARRAVTRDEQHPWNESDDRRLARALLGAALGHGAITPWGENLLVDVLALRRLLGSSSTLDVSIHPPLLGGGKEGVPGAASSEEALVARAPKRGDLASDDSPIPSPTQKGRAGGDSGSRGSRGLAPASHGRFLRFVELTTAALGRRSGGSEREPRLGLGARLLLLGRARLFRAS